MLYYSILLCILVWFVCRLLCIHVYKINKQYTIHHTTLHYTKRTFMKNETVNTILINTLIYLNLIAFGGMEKTFGCFQKKDEGGEVRV